MMNIYKEFSNKNSFYAMLKALQNKTPQPFLLT